MINYLLIVPTSNTNTTIGDVIDATTKKLNQIFRHNSIDFTNTLEFRVLNFDDEEQLVSKTQKLNEIDLLIPYMYCSLLIGGLEKNNHITITPSKISEYNQYGCGGIQVAHKIAELKVKNKWRILEKIQNKNQIIECINEKIDAAKSVDKVWLLMISKNEPKIIKLLLALLCKSIAELTQGIINCDEFDELIPVEAAHFNTWFFENSSTTARINQKRIDNCINEIIVEIRK